MYCQHVGESGEKLFQAAEQLGLEGVIGKKADSPYRAGRTTNWVKVKTSHGRHIDESGRSGMSSAPAEQVGAPRHPAALNFLAPAPVSRRRRPSRTACPCSLADVIGPAEPFPWWRRKAGGWHSSSEVNAGGISILPSPRRSPLGASRRAIASRCWPRAARSLCLVYQLQYRVCRNRLNEMKVASGSDGAFAEFLASISCNSHDPYRF